MKHPPKKRKTYGKSLRRIAAKLGMQYLASKKKGPQHEAGGKAFKQK